MNKKGQVLVAFVSFLPILFLLGILIIETGSLYVEKRKINNSVKDAIEYGLNHIEDENTLVKLQDLLKLNNKNIDNLNINITYPKIEVKLEKSKKSIFFGKKYKIVSFYKGYIDKNKNVIERIDN